MFSPMGSIGRYMFRATMGAFLITLVSLTVVIWSTQAMRDFDLITSQRQTLLVFIGLTGMIIPLLVMMIAPIAVFVAVAHVLNKLSSDSEIIVMNAAGVSPWRLLRPFLAAAFVVSLLVAVIAAYVSPRSLRELREWGAQVRLACAFLGPPQTNRQSRTLALLGMIGVVALLRFTGFVSVI